MEEGGALTVEFVRERFNYYPSTGVLTWRTNVRSDLVGKAAGTLQGKGYLSVVINNEHRILVHRLIWIHFYGREPKETIDHVNRIKTDNRIANLREASWSQQIMNQGMRSNNTSGFKGVIWDRDRNRYAAQLMLNGRNKYLGRFERIEDAIAARKAAEEKYFGEFAPQAA